MNNYSNQTNHALVIVMFSVGILLVYMAVEFIMPMFQTLTNTLQGLGL